VCKCFLQVSSINRTVPVVLFFCYGAELPLGVQGTTVWRWEVCEPQSGLEHRPSPKTAICGTSSAAVRVKLSFKLRACIFSAVVISK
jgi:hypothetical protein